MYNGIMDTIRERTARIEEAAKAGASAAAEAGSKAALTTLVQSKASTATIESRARRIKPKGLGAAILIPFLVAGGIVAYLSFGRR